ncbi:hypothetical protein CS542_05225 [Pedobacter sp. IW39]|nr:hypothetical protein CS542_05225 [Pedobacter sp. IW39]
MIVMNLPDRLFSMPKYSGRTGRKLSFSHGFQLLWKSECGIEDFGIRHLFAEVVESAVVGVKACAAISRTGRSKALGLSLRNACDQEFFQ